MKPKRSWVSKTKMMPGLELGVLEFFVGSSWGGKTSPKKIYLPQLDLRTSLRSQSSF